MTRYYAIDVNGTIITPWCYSIKKAWELSIGNGLEDKDFPADFRELGWHGWHRNRQVVRVATIEVDHV